MSPEPPAQVMSVSSARAQLTKIVAAMRSGPSHADAIVFGSHRKPEAVIVPYRQYAQQLLGHPAHDSSGTSLLDALRDKSGLIHRLAHAANIGRVSVFGSVARGDETEDSDIDLLVDTDPGASYFDVAQFAMDVEALIGRRVDAVPVGALDKARDRAILRESVEL